MKDNSCQYDIDTKPKTTTRGVLTEALFKKNIEVQVSLSSDLSFKEDKKTEQHKTPSKIIRKG